MLRYDPDKLLNDYKAELAEINAERAAGKLSPYMKYLEKVCNLAIATYDEAKAAGELHEWFEVFEVFEY